MMSDGHEVPTCAFEEMWILIQRFKRHICCKFQIVSKWVPRNDTILPSITRPINGRRAKKVLQETDFLLYFFQQYKMFIPLQVCKIFLT